ncbi:MAG: hypothetical protein RL266_1072 [Bacteroidota bacterium]
MLKDPELNRQVSEQGFVKVRFFEESLLKATLQAMMHELNSESSSLKGKQNPDNNVTFHSTFLDTDQTYKAVVWKHLSKLFKPLVNELLCGHRIIQASIFNKPPGEGFISPHQNLTTVDEEKFTSLSIWTPLQDTNEVNGTLHFKPRSHGHFEKFRNGDIWWPPLSITQRIEDYGMVPVNVSLGEVLIFDDSLVHGSPANHSDTDRLIFHCLAIPNNAPAIYCKKMDGKVELIEVDDSYWQFSRPGKPVPTGNVLKVVDFESTTYTKDMLFKEIGNAT